MDVCWRLHLLFSNRRKLYRYVISGKVLSPQNDFQQAYARSDKFEMVVNSYRKHVKWPLLMKTAKNHPFEYIHLFPLCTFHHFLMSHLGISIIPCLSIRRWCNMWTVESEGERGVRGVNRKEAARSDMGCVLHVQAFLLAFCVWSVGDICLCPRCGEGQNRSSCGQTYFQKLVWPA